MALLAMTAAAGNLTPDQTLSRFLDRQPDRAPAYAASQNYQLCYIGDENALYAFNASSGGFVILSADEDSEAPLLGYGPTAIDPDNMPPALDWMLQTMSRSRLSSTPAMAPHAAISPMITTRWGQDAPYNDNCPKMKDTRAYTGCMATAIAQVLAYDRNRMQGSGSHSYVWEGTGRSLSFNYRTHPFDYDAMTDEYTDASTDESKSAVANLMYGVGIACDMNYGTDASGAVDYKSAMGLVRNLGCDAGLKVLNRDFFTAAEWDEIIYNQLASGRPIVYTGVGRVGGHAFVCDGYERNDDSNFYHINWGWEGMSDGYFMLSLLNPEHQGIGGDNTAEGFNTTQSAYIGIEPARDDSKPAIIFWQYGALAAKGAEYTRDDMVTLLFTGNSRYNGGAVVNGSLVSLNATAGLRFTDVATGEVSYHRISDPQRIDPIGGFGAFNFPATFFPERDATYRAELVMDVDGEWVDVYRERAYMSDLEVKVEGNKLSFKFYDKGERLRIEFTTLPKQIVSGQKTKITIDVTAGVAPVDTKLYPGLAYYNGYGVALMSGQPLVLPLGGSTTISWDEPFEPAPAKGSYLLVIIDSEGNVVSIPAEVRVVDESGIEMNVADPVEYDVEYYSLDGRRLNGHPRPGNVVIAKQGDTVSKIVSH